MSPESEDVVREDAQEIVIVEETEDDGQPSSMPGSKLKSIMEALLFVSEQPLSLDKMAAIIGECSKKELGLLLNELNEEYQENGRAFQIVEVAHGYQVRTRSEFGSWLGKLQTQRFQRLSRAAMETLAIVAYRQPVTRAEIESIRGVDSGGVLGSLMEKNMIRILGRKEVPGRPMIYGTTQEFLLLFGLKNLSNLPTLREIEDMLEEAQKGRDGYGEAQDGEPGGDVQVVTDSDAAQVAVAAAEEGVEVVEEGVAGSSREDAPSAAEIDQAGFEVRVAPPAPGEGLDGETAGDDGEVPEDYDEDLDMDDGDLETAELDEILRKTKTGYTDFESIVPSQEDQEEDQEDQEEREEREMDGAADLISADQDETGDAVSDDAAGEEGDIFPEDENGI